MQQALHYFILFFTSFGLTFNPQTPGPRGNGPRVHALAGPKHWDTYYWMTITQTVQQPQNLNHAAA